VGGWECTTRSCRRDMSSAADTASCSEPQHRCEGADVGGGHLSSSLALEAAEFGAHIGMQLALEDLEVAGVVDNRGVQAVGTDSGGAWRTQRTT
jgi:hypothetical protein